MSSPVLQRARSSWLLAFGDVITLLLTFFIVVVAMNKSDQSKIDVWVDQQLNASYQTLADQVGQNGYRMISVSREPRGVLLTVQSDDAFESGAFKPSMKLTEELSRIAELLPTTRVLDIKADEANRAVIDRAAEDGYQWLAEISVMGHTDSDWIDPESTLRNNFFLSTLRAESVMYLLQNSSGLQPELFSIAGFGEWQPIESSESESGKNRNRRVEILITAGFFKNGNS